MENEQGIRGTIGKGAQIRISDGKVVWVEGSEFTYISPNGVRVENIKGVITIYKTGGNIYLLFPSKKKYMEFDQVKMQKMMDRLSDQVSAVMGERKVDINNTVRKKIVENWDTTIWEVDIKCKIFTTKTTLYQTMDINIPDIYYEFKKNLNEILWSSLFKNMIEAYEKINGFNVMVDSKIENISTKQVVSESVEIYTKRVVSVEEKNLPVSIFEIPSDYKRVKFDPKAFLERSDAVY